MKNNASSIRTPSPSKQLAEKSSPKRGSKPENTSRRSPPGGSKSMKSATKASDAIVKQEENYLARCNNYRLTTGYEVTICNCKHIRKIRIGERHSICNPQRWLCNTCLTTESVWACLSCPNVACGRFIMEHALTHFQETGHPLTIDVNELYVYCYKCDDYVLNDNNSSDIKVLRETLLAIRYQNFTGTTRSGHTLRSAMITEKEDLDMRRQMQQEQLDRDDRLFTAIWHSRFVRQRKAFRHWIRYIRWKRTQDAFVSESEEEADDSIVEQETVENMEPEASSSPLVVMVDTETAKEDLVLEFQELPPSPRLVPEDAILDLPTLAKPPEPAASTTSEVLKPTLTKEERDTTEHKTETVDEVATITEPAFGSTDSVVAEADVMSRAEEIPKITATPEAEDNLVLAPVEPEAQGHPDTIVASDTVATEDDVSDILEDFSPVALNILSRPKRSNAAGRYREIFNQLVGPGTVKRDLPYPAAKPSSEEQPAKKRAKRIPTPGDRRSVRIEKIEREKEILAKRRMAKKKRGPRFRFTQRKRERRPTGNRMRPARTSKISRNRQIGKKTRSAGGKSSRARRLITGSVTPERKRLNSYRPPSLYDNIPNKAVTSLIPGVTGLRNLGNTCYLNSIIQVLGHLQKFRLSLLALREIEFDESFVPNSKCKLSESFSFTPPQNCPTRAMPRRSTVELYLEQNKPTTPTVRNSDRKKSGLNGGQSPNDSVGETLPVSPSKRTHCSPTSSARSDGWSSSLSLSNELDHLYQVMWSGKWKLVSPYHFLHSVWNLIPSFRGYTQQDAQEFLCELLDKIVSELEKCYSTSKSENKLALRILKVVQKVFEGRLMSRVRCLECGHVSSTVEPFWDLSLEFPERYHKINSNRRPLAGARTSSVPSDPCTLHEMLQNFTAPETLEGGRVYGCAKCNFLQQPKGSTQKKRPLYRKNSQLLTEAEKQLKVLELPQVIRFHLKRFRWIGRNHREKIAVHVEFPSELDLRPYCWNSNGCETTKETQYMYDLSAVVMHHGRGFGSGHYTANCWNDIGEFWVHCNDSNLELRSIEDVMTSQAYILFYTQRGLDPHPHVLSPPNTPLVSSPLNLSPTASEPDAKVTPPD